MSTPPLLASVMALALLAGCLDAEKTDRNGAEIDIRSGPVDLMVTNSLVAMPAGTSWAYAPVFIPGEAWASHPDGSHGFVLETLAQPSEGLVAVVLFSIEETGLTLRSMHLGWNLTYQMSGASPRDDTLGLLFVAESLEVSTDIVVRLATPASPTRELEPGIVAAGPIASIASLEWRDGTTTVEKVLVTDSRAPLSPPETHGPGRLSLETVHAEASVGLHVATFQVSHGAAVGEWDADIRFGDEAKNREGALVGASGLGALTGRLVQTGRGVPAIELNLDFPTANGKTSARLLSVVTGWHPDQLPVNEELQIGSLAG